MASLPPAGEFDETNEGHLESYSQFIDAFGTHVVTRIVLGGKHIVSTELESKDVMELKRQKVSISQTLSFEAAVGIGSMASQATQDAAAAASKPKVASSTSTSSDYTVTVFNLDEMPKRKPPPIPCTKPDGTPQPGRPASCNKPKSTQGLGFSSSFGREQSKSSESSSEQLFRIQSKVSSRNEITIGGTPPKGESPEPQSAVCAVWIHTCRNFFVHVSISTVLLNICAHSQHCPWNYTLIHYHRWKLARMGRVRPKSSNADPIRIGGALELYGTRGC